MKVYEVVNDCPQDFGEAGTLRIFKYKAGANAFHSRLRAEEPVAWQYLIIRRSTVSEARK